MAIEVVRKGVLPDDIQYEAECTRCCTRIKFKGADGETLGSTLDSTKQVISVPCPVCPNHHITAPLRTPADELARRSDDMRNGYFGR